MGKAGLCRAARVRKDGANQRACLLMWVASVTLSHQPRPLELSSFPSTKQKTRVTPGITGMDTIIDARFERVEKALASLVESVSKYHPYAKQALDLQEADRLLSEGLQEGRKDNIGSPNRGSR